MSGHWYGILLMRGRHVRVGSYERAYLEWHYLWYKVFCTRHCERDLGYIPLLYILDLQVKDRLLYSSIIHFLLIHIHIYDIQLDDGVLPEYMRDPHTSFPCYCFYIGSGIHLGKVKISRVCDVRAFMCYHVMCMMSSHLCAITWCVWCQLI